MKKLLLAVFLSSGCELVDEASRRPGELERGASVPAGREERILRGFFDVDYAQRKVAHVVANPLLDFDSVEQPRPRIEDIIARHGMADETWEADLTPYGVSDRAVVFRYGRLGLATPTGRNDGEIFWTLILAGLPLSTSAR
jgi:hypothetical protein